MGNIEYNGQENSVSSLWPGAIIPYVISNDFPQNQPGDNRRQAIENAISTWNAQTNIRLVPRQHHQDYVEFKEATEVCKAPVGRLGRRQIIQCDLDEDFKGPINEMIGHILHEIGHAIGLKHEHSREDRDSFINVTSTDHNYAIAGNKHGAYDFKSVMHYFFNNNIAYRSGLPSDMHQNQVGRLYSLSAGDIAAVNYIAQECLKNYVAVNVSGQVDAYDDDRPRAPDRARVPFNHTYIIQRGNPFQLPHMKICADEVGVKVEPKRLVVTKEGALFFEGGTLYLYEDTKGSCGGNDLDGQARIPFLVLTASQPSKVTHAKAVNKEVLSNDYGEVTYAMTRKVNIGELLAQGHPIAGARALLESVEELEESSSESEELEEVSV